MKWADEAVEGNPSYEPDPKLESFYILAALEFGDPDDERWPQANALEFYAFWKKFRPPDGPNYLGATVILQYIFWYERSRPSVDSDLDRRSTRS